MAAAQHIILQTQRDNSSYISVTLTCLLKTGPGKQGASCLNAQCIKRKSYTRNCVCIYGV